MIIISDTSPLSNLAIVGKLHLLPEIYQTIIIPQAVAEELTNAQDEENIEEPVKQVKTPEFKAISLKTKGFKFNREEAND
ncbi:MAG: hypothetical protein QNJ37_01485 [Crocosphaera sp.]|nr:hypothetical protein [Crocosphaera sp.]